MPKKSRRKKCKSPQSKPHKSKSHKSKLQSESKNRDQGRFPLPASEDELPKRQLQQAIAMGKSCEVRALLSCHPWLLETRYPKWVTKANNLPPNRLQRQSEQEQSDQSSFDQIQYETVCHYYSPLHLAAMQGRPKIVRVLLECGADVMATTGPPPKLPPNLIIDSGNIDNGNDNRIEKDSDSRPVVTTSHLTTFHLTHSHFNDFRGHLPPRSNRTMHLPLYYAVLPTVMLAEVMLPDDRSTDAMTTDGNGLRSFNNGQDWLPRKSSRVRSRVTRLLLKQMREVVAEEWFYELTLAETIEQVIRDTSNAAYLIHDEDMDDEPFAPLFALEVLHGAKANWEARDLQGFSALHQAVVYENRFAYRWLSENGVDSNPTDNAGNTPLHLALWWGSDLMLVTVLRSPCDPLLPNHLGVSPYEMVLRSGCPNLRELFDSHPAIQKQRQSQAED